MLTINSEAIAVIDIMDGLIKKREKATEARIRDAMGYSKQQSAEMISAMVKANLIEYLSGTNSYHFKELGQKLADNSIDVQVELTQYTYNKYFTSTAWPWGKLVSTEGARLGEISIICGSVDNSSFPMEKETKEVAELIGGAYHFDSNLGYYVVTKEGQKYNILLDLVENKLQIKVTGGIMLNDLAEIFDEDYFTEFNDDSETDFVIDSKNQMLVVLNAKENFVFDDLKRVH